MNEDTGRFSQKEGRLSLGSKILSHFSRYTPFLLMLRYGYVISEKSLLLLLDILPRYLQPILWYSHQRK